MPWKFECPRRSCFSNGIYVRCILIDGRVAQLIFKLSGYPGFPFIYIPYPRIHTASAFGTLISTSQNHAVHWQDLSLLVAFGSGLFQSSQFRHPRGYWLCRHNADIGRPPKGSHLIETFYASLYSEVTLVSKDPIFPASQVLHFWIS